MRLKRAALGFLGTVLAVLVLDRAFPPPLPRSGEGTVVLAQDGTPLRAWPTSDGQWRYGVTPEEVSPLYLQALLGYEDRHFEKHPGVNPFAMVRALWQWIANGRVVSGGSTLTMQVARILEDPGGSSPPSAIVGGRGGGARSLLAKARQALRALQLEARYDKREILALYLNHAPMGGIVEGVEMASRTYLGKPARSLTHAEAALLAALPQSPTRRRPDLHAARAQEARDKVLMRMAALGIWPEAVVREAKMERVVVYPVRGGWIAPLAAERLRRQVPGASVVRSTIDAELQARIEGVLLDRVRNLPGHVSVAVMVMENDSLAVRAYAGSADFGDEARAAHVDMVRAPRSPGSTLKPFLYAIALDDALIHSESLLADVPQSFGGYAPGNFQASFSGPVSASEALVRSLNVPAVDLLDRVGPERFASTLRAGGVKLRMEMGARANLSLILGGASTTLEELVGAYRALAMGGMSGRPRLTHSDPTVEARIMSAGAAFVVRDILESGGRPGRPFDEGGSRPALAWKTGTSFGFRDAWALGVTDRYTLGVWIGRPDGTPNPGFFGANSAAPLAREIAAFLPTSVGAARPQPANVSARTICWPLGLARDATPEGSCMAIREAWVLDDIAPPTPPDRGRRASLRERVWVDAKGSRVNMFCDSGAREVELAHWPAHLEPWLPAKWIAHAPDWRADCRPPQPNASARALALRGLENGTIVRRAPGSAPATRVSVAAPGSEGKVYWLLDGRLVASQPASSSFSFEVRRDGLHTLAVLDDAGRHARVEFLARGFE